MTNINFGEDLSKYDGTWEGTFNVVIDSIEECESKTQEKGIKISFKAKGDAKNGEILPQQYFIFHSNQQTAAIAKRNLASIAKAAGIEGSLNNANQLIAKNLQIVCEKDGDYTKIKKYLPTPASVNDSVPF